MPNYRIPLLAIALLASTTVARAASCDASLQIVGDARNGQVYIAQVTVPGLEVASALGQIRAGAVQEKFEVGKDLITPKKGTLYLVANNANPPVVVLTTAEAGGQVSLRTRLAPGQTMTPDNARTAMCGLLNRLKPGKEGAAIAAAARSASGTDKVIDIDAVALSVALEKEAEATQRSLNASGLKGAFTGTMAPHAGFQSMQIRYLGQRLRLDGQVYTVTVDPLDRKTVDVAYLVTRTKGLLRLREGRDSNRSNYAVECTLADDQSALAGTLRPNDWVKLTGTVDDVGPSRVHLRDCRQAQ